MQAEELIAAHITAVRGTWDAEADDVLICRQVRRETHDVKTFVLEPRPPALFRYRPGQFLTFDFEIGAEQINRCYTISSSPARPRPSLEQANRRRRNRGPEAIRSGSSRGSSTADRTVSSSAPAATEPRFGRPASPPVT